MRAREVRRRIRDEHECLRAILFSIRTLGRSVLDGDPSHTPSLRIEGEALHEQLLEHLRWEDIYLAPTLRRARRWGRERAAQLDRDHREQRELLDYTLAALRDSTRPALALARNMIDLVELLLEDMADEDALLRDERIPWDANEDDPRSR
ncbi:MAG: hemerythrin domain-containing protein [Myxococcota bacterium]